MNELPNEILVNIISFNGVAEKVAARKIHKAYQGWIERLQEAADKEYWDEIYRARDDNRLWRSSHKWPTADQYYA